MSNNSKKWKKEDIKELLETNDIAVIRGWIRIYELQTEDEKQTEDTHHNNSVGFTGADGYILTSMMNNYIKWGQLTEKQFNLIKKKMMKYAGQLAKIANGEISGPPSNIKIRKDWLRVKKYAA